MNEVLEELRKSRSTPPPDNESMGDTHVDVETVVRNVLTAEEQKNKRKANNVATFDKLVEFYGSKSEAVRAINAFTQGKQNLVKLVDELGATEPDVCVNTITKLIAKRDDAPNTPGLETTSPANFRVGAGELTASKWRELRKKDPKEYERLRPTVMALVAKHGESWWNT